MTPRFKHNQKTRAYSTISGIFAFILVWAGAVGFFNKTPFQNDLTQFFPNQQSFEAQYLKHRLSPQQASSWLMLAVKTNDQPPVVQSQTIQSTLQTLPGVIQVLNGSETIQSPLQQTPAPTLYPYRYLLTPFSFSEAMLNEHIQQRWQEYQLGLMLDKHWLLDDPSYQWGTYLKQWQSSQHLSKQNGVWVSELKTIGTQSPQQLLLLIEVDKQPDLLYQSLLQQIESTLNQIIGQSHYQLSGADWIALKAEQEIKQAVNWVTALAISMVFLSLLIAFRSAKLILFSCLPLLGAFAIATLSTITLFGSMQLITLALGAILLGVAIDYPIHTITAFQSRQASVVQKIWTTIRLGALTSTFGFLMLWWVNIEGLQQIAIFASTGLLSALLLTQSLKPLLNKHFALTDIPAKVPTYQVEKRSEQHYFKPFFMLFLPGLVIIIMVLALKPLQWQDDIVSLSPVSPKLIETDKMLRSLFQHQEAGKKILVPASSIEALLQKQESLIPYLENLKKTQFIQQYQMLSQLLPSLALQRQRQQNLPTAKQLQNALNSATQSNHFQARHFDTFSKSLEQTRQLPLLNNDMFLQNKWISAELVQQHVVPLSNQILGVISLSGVTSDSVIENFTKKHAEHGLIYFNQRVLVANQISDIRSQLFQVLAILIAVLALSLGLKFQRVKDVFMILTPVLLAVGATLASFSLLEIPLSIFHLMSLMLIAAIGLDYSLLFAQGAQQVEHSQEWQRSIRVAFVTTLGSFAMLAFSQLALLHAIGLTVLIGVTWVYGLSYLSTYLSQEKY